MAIFDVIQNPIMPGYSQDGSMNNLSYEQQQQRYNQFQQMQHQYNPNYGTGQINTAPTPVISGGGYGFTVKPDEDTTPVQSPLNLPSPVDVGLDNTPKRRGRHKKEEVETVNSSEIVKAEGTVEDTSTINTYAATTMLLNNTLEQLDVLASEMKEELDQVRGSRTLKGKYNYIIGLSGNLSNIIGTKAQVIKEINNAITRANELDYKREKDRSAAATEQNDDKYIMDLYNSFIKNPMGVENNVGMLGPTPIQTTVNGSSIVRAPIAGEKQQGQPVDAGYLNYLSNLTPEQNMMFYEQDPNVKTCVIFDAATGNKFFQVMNVATGQAIPNVPVLDNRFMEDTTIDLKNKIAKNNNLHDTYPVIVINENITKEY